MDITNKQQAINYIQEIEGLTMSSFVRIGEGAEKLVVSFASAYLGNKKYIFQRKKSLLREKYDNNKNIDILYLRNKNHWYLGEMTRIGHRFDDLVNFLQKIFAEYKYVTCTGSSMGGYASLLLGSLLNADAVFANEPQTDIQYVLDYLEKDATYKKHQIRASLRHVNIHHPDTWSKYSNLSGVLNDTTAYTVHYKYENELGNNIYETVMHTHEHWDRIAGGENITRVYCTWPEREKYLINSL